MDEPLLVIAEKVADQVELGHTCWQKWTCPNCGSRQTMEEPNVLYRSGKCQACDTVSEIVVCGFMMVAGDNEYVEMVARSIKEA
jgi:hypothetical protein